VKTTGMRSTAILTWAARFDLLPPDKLARHLDLCRISSPSAGSPGCCRSFCGVRPSSSALGNVERILCLLPVAGGCGSSEGPRPSQAIVVCQRGAGPQLWRLNTARVASQIERTLGCGCGRAASAVVQPDDQAAFGARIVQS
jgi:hypothetical protein